MIGSILVPVDGSNHSTQAVEFAADLAQKYGARLIVVHVLTHLGCGRVPRHLRELASTEDGDIGDAEILKGVATAILDEARQRALSAGCHGVEAVRETGDPAGRIVKIAKDRGIDLVVMGRRGLGDLNGPLLGSVSHKVAQLVECACLTVK